MTRQTQSSSKIAQVLFGLLAYVSLGIGLVAIDLGVPTTDPSCSPPGPPPKARRASAPGWKSPHLRGGPWRNGKIIAHQRQGQRHREHVVCAVLMLVMLDHCWCTWRCRDDLGNLSIWSRRAARTPV